MPITIPDGLQDSHLNDINSHLQNILDELMQISQNLPPEQKPKRVTSRLNASAHVNPSPVWAGTVERDIADGQRQQRIRGRFKGRNTSSVYAQTITSQPGDIVTRNWSSQIQEKQQSGSSIVPPPYARPQNGEGPEGRCMHQKYIAIRVQVNGQHRHIGTITVGFQQEPINTQQIDQVLKKWAKEDSEYAQFVNGNFTLNGPPR